MNKTTLPDDSSEATNVITGIATRTRAASRGTFKSTTTASNETQRPNIVTGSSQFAAPQAAQSVAQQVSYDDDDDENYYNNVLPQNLDANEFVNVFNSDDFGFNTKTFHEIICNISNGNPLPANFTIEKRNNYIIVNGKFSNAVFNNTHN